MSVDSTPARSEFDALSPRPYPSQPPAFLIRIGLALHRALVTLAQRILPPEVGIFDLSMGMLQTQALAAVAKHRVADVLAGETLASEEIARRCGTSPDAMHRTLRLLAARGVFRLRTDGRFENNRLSNALRTGTLSRGRDWVEYFGSKSNADAWTDFGRTFETGEGAFPRVHGMSVWDWFGKHPEEEENFANAMMGVTVQDAPVVAGLYPFKEIKRLCDVGGGRGTQLSEILVRHPHLKGVLYDAPGVLVSARDLLGRRGLTDRVELATGNFFESVPTGCDAYLLKNVMHDWNDDDCVRILTSCRRSMQPGQRVIVVEMLTEANDSRGFGPASDLHMMVTCAGGRERSREELVALLEKSGFRRGRILDGAIMGVVEGIAA